MRPIYPEPLPILNGARLVQEQPGAVGAAGGFAVAFDYNILSLAVITTDGVLADTLLSFEEDLVSGGGGAAGRASKS